MEARISDLLKLANRYSVEELDIMYREREIELEKASFTKDIDVKWSEALKKKMLQQAKRKKISKGRKEYIFQLIEALNSFNYEDYLSIAISDAEKIIQKAAKLNFHPADLKLMHIEFPVYSQAISVNLYGLFQENYWENELGTFKHKVLSSKFWNFLESNKFARVSELLEIIDIGDSEYPLIFVEICELRVFELMKYAFNSDKLKALIEKNGFKHMNIEIGMHGANFFTIFN